MEIEGRLKDGRRVTVYLNPVVTLTIWDGLKTDHFELDEASDWLRQEVSQIVEEAR